MKSFEISQETSKNGRRHFKVILHEIYPDSCVDEIKGEGTLYNENGITWVRKYCEENLRTIIGKSIRVEFLDEERTEILGHGLTEIKDDLPLFENASMIGIFEDAYITDVDTPEGIKTVCVGEGTIDGLCYHNLTEKLDADIADGNAPYGSVEILKTGDNSGIVYKYGYKEYGRIPQIFEYSGYALLGVRPADQTAKLLELNTATEAVEEDKSMNENDIKAIVSQVFGELAKTEEEIEKLKEEYEARIAELEASIEEKENSINELNAEVDELKQNAEKSLDDKKELESKKEELATEVNALKADIERIESEKKIGELNSALGAFTDEQKDYAKAEIEEFKSNPLTCEINSVIEKIHAEIGKKFMEAEKNESDRAGEIEDIFSEINSAESEEDVDIF